MTGKQFKNERLKRALNQTEWADLLGISLRTVQSYEKKENELINEKLRISFLEMIKKEITPEQLAYLKNPKKFPENLIDNTFTKNMLEVANEERTESNGVPYYDNVEVTASITKSFSDVQENPDFFIDYKHFNDCTAYFPIYGDSMYPKFVSGEIVAVKQIFNLNVILWGETYLVITNQDGGDLRTIKTVHPYDDDNIILRASNPNFKGDTIIPKSSILSMYIVKGKINRGHL